MNRDIICYNFPSFTPKFYFRPRKKIKILYAIKTVLEKFDKNRQHTSLLNYFGGRYLKWENIAICQNSSFLVIDEIDF